jgi:hypothetical protein
MVILFSASNPHEGVSKCVTVKHVRIKYKDVECIKMSRGRSHWRALENIVVVLQVP